MRTLPRLAAIIVILAAAMLSPSAQACPSCKEAIGSQTGEGARMKDGYFYSILFMVAMPFTLLGTGAFLVTRAVRRGGLPEM
jgi:hypothetical protein